MSEFNNRLSKLISLDKIRFGKFLEITQYSFLGVVVTLVIMIFVGFISKKIGKIIDTKVKDIEYIKKNPQFLLKFAIVLSCKVILAVIVIFYVRKIILLCPSVASYLIKGFKPYTTIEYTIHVCTIFIVLELLYDLHDDLKLFYEYLYY